MRIPPLEARFLRGIALVTTVMPVLLLIGLPVLAAGNVGGRTVFALAAMTALIAFVFVQFLRSTRDLDDADR